MGLHDTIQEGVSKAGEYAIKESMKASINKMIDTATADSLIYIFPALIGIALFAIFVAGIVMKMCMDNVKHLATQILIAFLVCSGIAGVCSGAIWAYINFK